MSYVHYNDPTGEAQARNIPDSYVRFDTRVTDPEMPANVRDMQRFAQNHNVLMARRVRQMLFTISAMEDDAGDDKSPTPKYSQGVCTVNNDRTTGYMILKRLPVTIPRYTKSCTFVLSGFVSTGTANVYLWPVIDAAYASPRPLITDERITVATSAAARPTAFQRNAGTVTVPEAAANDGYGLFSCYIECIEYGSEQNKGGSYATISDVCYTSPYWIEEVVVGGGAASLSVGSILYIYNSTPALRTDIDPVVITSIVSDTSRANDYHRYYVDRKFSGTITPGSDLMAARACSYLQWESASLYANAITDFDAEVPL